jgi:hypothetical protein
MYDKLGLKYDWWEMAMNEWESIALMMEWSRAHTMAQKLWAAKRLGRVNCKKEKLDFQIFRVRFTICPLSEGIWFYTLSLGQSTSWTERFDQSFALTPDSTKLVFSFVAMDVAL